MSTQNDFSRSFKVNAAMSAGLRVAVSSNGYIGLAGRTDPGVGVLQEDCTSAAYENPKVRFWGTGSVGVIGTGAPATAGDLMFAVVTGQVAPTQASTPQWVVGRLLESYTVNGSRVEIAPIGPAPFDTANLL
jgi:hypothetical protein